MFFFNFNRKLHFIISQNKKIMSTLQDLQDAVANVQTALDTKQQAIADAIKGLEDQIAALSSGGTITEAQLTPIVDALKATQADIESTPTA